MKKDVKKEAANTIAMQIAELESKKIHLFISKSQFTINKYENGVETPKEYEGYILNYNLVTPKMIRKLRADLRPADVGGYEIIQLAFDYADKLELFRIDTERTDMKTNKIIRDKAFCIHVNGVEFKLKAAEPSDRVVLDLIYNDIEMKNFAIHKQIEQLKSELDGSSDNADIETGEITNKE